MNKLTDRDTETIVSWKISPTRRDQEVCQCVQSIINIMQERSQPFINPVVSETIRKYHAHNWRDPLLTSALNNEILVHTYHQ